jgi:hypothetical protein
VHQEKHRVAFEHVADIKHQRGLQEEGAVIVKAGDLKTFSSQHAGRRDGSTISYDNID